MFAAGRVLGKHLRASSQALPLGTRYNSTAPRPVFVQKYGGTSVGNPEKLLKVLGIVNEWREKGDVVAVVSAFSSETKSEGTTTRLLNAAHAAINNQDFRGYLNKIKNTHNEVLYKMFRDPELKDEAIQFVTDELNTVDRFCDSLTVIRELSPRSHDMIIGCGERLSAGLISLILKENGIPSVNVNLSNAFRPAIDPSKAGYQHIARKHILEAITKARDESGQGVVPVVTGYMGEFQGGILSAVGRGYSDLTAALVAAALNATALQVWKESDGIFTGNPTKIEKAKLLNHVTPSEAAELTYFGNEVLHPFTMECAIEANIPIHILNTFKPSSPGTIIDPYNVRQVHKGVTAVACKKNVTIVNLQSNRKVGSLTYLARVFELCATHGVKIDLISTTEANLSLTVHESVSDRALSELEKGVSSFATCSMRKGRAIVSVIGEGMAHQVGLAGKLFHSLSTAGVNVEMITQGASEINMSVVIEQSNADKAVAAVHKSFLEDNN